jgi:LPS-assembly protein
MKLRVKLRSDLRAGCVSALCVWCLLLFVATPLARAGMPIQDALNQKTLFEAGKEPWKIDAAQLSYDKKNGVYQAEGSVHIYSGERSLHADWARFDTRRQEAELRGSVFIKYGQDWMKGEHATWNLEHGTGSVESGLIFFSKNHFYVQGKRITKSGQTEYELDDGVITSCDPGGPDWSMRFKHMKVDTEGIGWARETSFWVRQMPVAYAPLLAFPANNARQSGLLIPSFGTSALNGIAAELPFYWAIRPDMDATLYAQYMEKRGFMGGAEFRVANPTYGEGIWLFNYLQDQVDKDHLLEEGFGFEQRERYWLRSRHNFTLPYQIEGRLDLDIVSDRNYLKEFEMGSTSWDVTNNMFTQFFGRGLINDKTIPVRETILYLNHREESSNLGMDVHYWENLDKSQDEFTLQQFPRVFYDVAPSFIGDTPLYYTLNSSWVDYWREERSRGQRWDVHPRLYYPVRFAPYLDLEPSIGVRASEYAVDWNGDPVGGGRSPWQGRLVPDVRMEMSSTLSRVYSLDYAELKGIQHVIRPEIAYEYIPAIGQNSLPQFDSYDRIGELNDIRYGFSTYLISKWIRPDAKGDPLTSYGEGARLRVTQALNIEKGSINEPSNLLFDSFLSDVPEFHSATLPDRRFSDVSVELDLTPARFLTLSYESFVSPYEGSETGRDLFMTLVHSRGHSLVVDYRTRQDPNVDEVIGQINFKVLSNIILTTRYDYSFDQEQAFSQAYAITYQRDCWAITLAYKEEAGDQQVFLSVNLLGLGHLGGGYSPVSGGTKLAERP